MRWLGRTAQFDLAIVRQAMERYGRGRMRGLNANRKFLSMNLAIELFFSKRDHNHSFGENLEKCLIEVDLMASRGGSEKYIFSVLLPTLCLQWDRLERGGCVSG